MKPIIFSSEMVKAILAGRKSQTRRVIKPQPVIDTDKMWRWKDCQWMDGGLGFPESGIEDHSTYKPGNVLWVREKWRLVDFEHVDGDWNASIQFADGEIGERLHHLKRGADEITGWRSPIHMPRAAARLFLLVTDVKVEQVQEISETDAIREGCVPLVYRGIGAVMVPARGAYYILWNELNGKRDSGDYIWERNPWVFVYSFAAIMEGEARCREYS